MCADGDDGVVVQSDVCVRADVRWDSVVAGGDDEGTVWVQDEDEAGEDVQMQVNTCR